MHQAFILTTVIINDADAFAEYRSAVGHVNAKVGGEMCARGSVQDVLEGDAVKGEVVVVLGFAHADMARAYIASPEYAALAPLRVKAGHFTIRLVT